jgi:hypothetical protein
MSVLAKIQRVQRGKRKKSFQNTGTRFFAPRIYALSLPTRFYSSESLRAQSFSNKPSQSTVSVARETWEYVQHKCLRTVGCTAALLRSTTTSFQNRATTTNSTPFFARQAIVRVVGASSVQYRPLEHFAVVRFALWLPNKETKLMWRERGACTTSVAATGTQVSVQPEF